jgi:RNA polymerase sigma factor for flagellar operon FliA
MADSDDASAPPPDSPEVLARLREGLDLVEIIARQVRRQCGPWVHLEDLVSQGREALLSCARSYDPERGIPFRRWVNLRVRGAMIEAVRAHGNLPKRVYRKLRAMQDADRVHEVAAEEDTSALPTTAARTASPEAADAKLSDQLGSAAMAMALSFLTMRSGDALENARDENDSPEEAVGRAELVGRLRAAIAERPDAERMLLERHYFGDATMEEAAKELGLSKSWASRLHARALEGVARSIRRQKIEG